jgi:hypothetical protein
MLIRRLLSEHWRSRNHAQLAIKGAALFLALMLYVAVQLQRPSPLAST